ncbi:VC0807 family protein [Amycolatopsis sp.]|uniref:VC0807 family protein n=1 Tax=Amycolatopsis sp. TaxID=37632 RepID=UPI002CADE8B6|nr:VC0807 family protein [Amycolatopsis sp.]HVV12949.1 VC0807 family protein [Amycolatopsis sp.]
MIRFLPRLLDIAAPIALYYLLHGIGFSMYHALLLSSVPSVLTTGFQLLRNRKLNALAGFMAAMTLLSAAVAVVSGNERFLLAKEGFLTAATGFWMLVTTRADKPVVYHFAQFLLEGRIGGGEPWESLWVRSPGFRRVWRTANVIWGTATLLDAGVRFLIAYTLPVNLVPALNGAQYAVLFLFLQVVTNIYYFRAGLFNPHSALYAKPWEPATRRP